jgi:hypothetical protein
MAIFIQYPWLAAVVGILLLGLGSARGRRAPLIAGALWVLYAAYEFGMTLRWLCTGECNIRVDLILIYPLLLIATVGGLVGLLRPSARSAK